MTIHRAAGVGDLPLPGAAGAGRQPVPVRQRGRRHGLHLQSAGAAALPVAAVRSAARPHRPAGRPAAGHPGGLAGRARRRRSRRRPWPAGWRRRGRPRRSGWPAPGSSLNSQVPGRLLRERWAVPAGLAAAGRAGAGARRAVGPRASTACCGSPGRWPTWPAGPCRAPTRWPRRSACACSGWRRDRADEDLEDAAAAAAHRRACSGAAPGPGLAEPGRRARHASTSGATSTTSGRSRRSGGCARARRPDAIARRSSGARAGQDESLADLRRAERCGARLVVPEDDEWPALPLHALTVAVGRRARRTAGRSPTGRSPRCRRWRCGCAGRPARRAGRPVGGVVGSRASTAYGEHVAAELGHQLGERGWTVVSGGAFGIDAAAHRGALAAEAPTVAVLACGVDRPYPAGARCAVRTASPRPGCWSASGRRAAAPLRHRFLVRNRLIAALTRGTVVVEAAARSGAQATAQRAQRLGRQVMVVPGPVTSAMSVGCHELLRDEEARRPAGGLGRPRHRGGRRLGADLADAAGAADRPARRAVRRRRPGARRLPGPHRGQPGAAGRGRRLRRPRGAAGAARPRAGRPGGVDRHRLAAGAAAEAGQGGGDGRGAAA